METDKQTAGVAIRTPDIINLKQDYTTRDKEGPSNSNSGYLSEETQNTKSKRHMHPYAYCSIIYNSPDMEAN